MIAKVFIFQSAGAGVNIQLMFLCIVVWLLGCPGWLLGCSVGCQGIALLLCSCCLGVASCSGFCQDIIMFICSC